MTINQGSFDRALVGDKLNVGDVVDLEILGVGFDKLALAVHVCGVPSDNKVAHITIAHSPIGKPVNSNFIKHWTDIHTISVSGFLIQTLSRADNCVNSLENAELSTRSDGASVNEMSAMVASLEITETKMEEKAEGLLIVTRFPTTDKNVLRGTVKEMKNYGVASSPTKSSPVPKNPNGVSLGDLVRKYHPNLAGREIGEALQKIRTWVAENGVMVPEQIEDYVKTSLFSKGMPPNVAK